MPYEKTRRKKLFAEIFTSELLGLALGVMSLLLAVGTVKIGPKKRLNQTKVWKYAGPSFPVSLGVLGAFVPGVCPVSDQGLGSVILFGLVAGMAAVYTRTVFKPLFISHLEGKL